MSAKVYFLKFGQGDARTYSGLTPTFLQFFDSSGQTLAPPSISEVKYGGVTASGIYGFSYLIGITTQNSIYFLANSATILTLANDNYVSGVLDPVLAVDQQLTAAGITNVAQGTTLAAQGTILASQGSTILAIGNSLNSIMAFNASFIGSTASSFGSSSVDPSSVFGYLKRLQELLEGDQVFAASSGQWLLYNRASLGTTTLLRTKTVVNQGSQVTKTGV